MVLTEEDAKFKCRGRANKGGLESVHQGSPKNGGVATEDTQKIRFSGGRKRRAARGGGLRARNLIMFAG